MITRVSLILVAVSFGSISLAQSPTLAVDINSSRHPINPNIYGIANYGLDAAFAQEIKVPNIRWGGDGTTRYNWKVDSSNAGFDWYFMGGSGTANPVPSASPDAMVRAYSPAAALITIPIIPYVNSTSAWTCSFPTSIYGAQQSTNPYVHPNGEDCGNSISSNGTQLLDTNIYANHIDNSTALQQGWIQHLVATFGTAAKGGVPFYQLDNEPSGWSNTHRDVEPTTPPYSTIISLGQQYATMIKQEDPSASVLGPSDFTLGGWIGTPSQQNNLYAGQYYLQQMAAYDKTNGTRTLDYFDEHYYPQFSDPTSQLASTRTFWDPTYNGGTWVEQYYFDGPMQLIPRFQSWIAQYYPGTKLSFSEYSIDSGNKLITDALAEADVLGILGWQGVDFANMWSPPAPTDPIAYAFRLFRNYDGQGGQFGDVSVQATSSNQGQLSVYAATRTADDALTLIVINKTTAAIQTALSIANFNSASSAEVYSYSGANLTQITAAGSISASPTGFSYNFPAYSATVFVLAGSAASGSLNLTPTTQNFPNTTIGASSATQTSTLTNGTANSITLSSGTLTDATDFTETDNCNGALASGASCTLTFTFKPASAGTLASTFSIKDSTDASIATTASLTGTGVAAPTPTASLTPASFNFGAATVGESSTDPSPETFTLTNTGTVAVTPGSVSVTGSGFTLISGNCGTSLAAGSSCTMAVTFQPAAVGTATGTISIITSAGTKTSTLTGNGVAAPTPTATLTPASFNFSSATVGESNTDPSPETFTLTNTGTLPVTPGSVTVTGSGFTLIPGNCGTSLAAGSSCTLSISFQPTAAGAVTGTLSILTNAGTKTSTLTATGVAGTPSDFTLSSSQGTLIVEWGSFANLHFQLASSSIASPFTSAVLFSVSGLPAGATASFSPSSVTPGVAGASTTMTVFVPASTAKNELTLPPSPGKREAAFGGSLALLVGFFFRRRREIKLLLCLFALGLVGSLVGCGTNLAVGINSSTIVVTATGGSISHTASVALTVQ